MVPKRLNFQPRTGPTVIEIDDPTDPRVGDFFKLNDTELRRRREQPDGDAGFFVAEGALVIRHLLQSPYPVRSVLVTPQGLAALEADVAASAAPVFVVDQPVMAAVAGFHFHRGALASAARLPPAPLDQVAGAAERVLVVEGVNDNENLGALFRNAAAFGVGGVVLDRATADPLYRRTVRVSMGHALRIPFARVDHATAAVARLQALGFEVLALTPATWADDVRHIPVRPRQALLVGAEGPGLTAAALEAADRCVRIPMAAGVDSLNVATAAAIALHHLAPPA
jgi:tRNA G18 (ribose-2'-O)-methylase SpoU